MLKKEHLVEKRNILNEMRDGFHSLQEVRIFSIYLSCINPRIEETRQVIFSLDEYKKIMNIEEVHITRIKKSFKSLLQKVVSIPNNSGGFSSFQLFKECKLYHSEDGAYMIEMDAHDKALPLMFDFKEEYFTYELWNALPLNGKNQLRMYEILKQYEALGVRILKIRDLKDLLCIGDSEYASWSDFRKYVLDSCQKALTTHTDITYVYTPLKTGRKFTDIKFDISKNYKYVDKVKIDEFSPPQIEEMATNITTILPEHTPFLSESHYAQLMEIEMLFKEDALFQTAQRDFEKEKIALKESENKEQMVEVVKKQKPIPQSDSGEAIVREFAEVATVKKPLVMPERFKFLSSAMNDEFNPLEMEVIFNIICTKELEIVMNDTNFTRYHFLSLKYSELNYRASGTPIKNRFAYFLKMIT